MICDVCGLPDPYRGQGDGIGSCDCPRCDCGTARSSALCTCPPDDDYPYDDEDGCDCIPGLGCPHVVPWPDDVYVRPIVTVHLPAEDLT